MFTYAKKNPGKRQNSKENWQSSIPAYNVYKFIDRGLVIVGMKTLDGTRGSYIGAHK